MYSHIKISENLEAKLYISGDIAYIGNIKYKNQSFNDIVRLLTICKEQAFKVFHCTHVIGPNDGPCIGVMGGITESEYDLGTLSAYDVSLKDAMIHIGFQPLYDKPRPICARLDTNRSIPEPNMKGLTKSKLSWGDITEKNCITIASMWDNVLKPEQVKTVMKHYFETTNCLDYSFKVTDENNQIAMYSIMIRTGDDIICKQIASRSRDVSIVDLILSHANEFRYFFIGPFKNAMKPKNLVKYNLSTIGTNQQYMLSKDSNP